LSCPSQEELEQNVGGEEGLLEMLGADDSQKSGIETDVTAIKLESFFANFWAKQPEVPKTLRLELGGPRPRLLVGEEFSDDSNSPSAVRFLGNTFSSRSSLWYAPIRAVGLSRQESGGQHTLLWSVDFNSFSPYGAPALFDSGSNAIRVGRLLFEQFITNMPEVCELPDATAMLECPCDADFPSIAISFEAGANFRVLGLDAGLDVSVCIPPSAYVMRHGKEGKCRVAIANGGTHHVAFGLESIVLGVPFFRSVSVAYDLDRQLVGLGATPAAGGNAPSGDESYAADGKADDSFASDGNTSDGGGVAPAGDDDKWAEDNEGGDSAALDRGNQAEAENAPQCADPKNWWFTHHRFSPRRAELVLLGTAVVIAYVLLSHSPHAEGLRAACRPLCCNDAEGGVPTGARPTWAEPLPGRPEQPPTGPNSVFPWSHFGGGGRGGGGGGAGGGGG